MSECCLPPRMQMQFSRGEISDYSDLTAGQYEGLVLKRERHYKWRSYWCVLYGRQLTFYDDAEKRHVVGQIELQPGSHCDKEKTRIFPSPAELVHRKFTSLKKYPLRLKTKKGTHLFTYEDVKERTRWQMAINNASQENGVNGVRLSWIPTPFSMVTTPTQLKPRLESTSTMTPEASPTRTITNTVDGKTVSDNHHDSQQSQHMVLSTAPLVRTKSKPKQHKNEETRTLIHDETADTPSPPTTPFAFTNPYVDASPREQVTSL